MCQGGSDEDKLVYELTFELPDAGLPLAGEVQHYIPLGDDFNDTNTVAVVRNDKTSNSRSMLPDTSLQECGRHPIIRRVCTARNLSSSRQCARSQGCTQGKRLMRLTKEKQLLATTTPLSLIKIIDDVSHKIDAALRTTSGDKLKVWA